MGMACSPDPTALSPKKGCRWRLGPDGICVGGEPTVAVSSSDPVEEPGGYLSPAQHLVSAVFHSFTCVIPSHPLQINLRPERAAAQCRQEGQASMLITMPVFSPLCDCTVPVALG